jgi:hypothetical protein
MIATIHLKSQWMARRHQRCSESVRSEAGASHHRHGANTRNVRRTVNIRVLRDASQMATCFGRNAKSVWMG